MYVAVADTVPSLSNFFPFRGKFAFVCFIYRQLPWQQSISGFRHIFVELSSTKECYCHPPPKLEMIASKQACFIKQTNIVI
jgi:hypothetical protein